jgi:hypothetical protein
MIPNCKGNLHEFRTNRKEIALGRFQSIVDSRS